MTKEEMQAKISEAMGWRVDQYDCLPNYPEDLNAMAEARKTLTEKEKAVFADAIAWTTGNSYDPYYDGWGGLTLLDVFAMIDAPAEKQAEAFLKAKGLWKE